MPKTSEMRESKFLKQGDVGAAVLWTVEGCEKVNVAKEGAEPEYKWALTFTETDKPLGYEPLRVTALQVEQLERWIDGHNVKLQPLTSFILPGGSPAGALLHLARTVCRRAERRLVSLAGQEEVEPLVLAYLNRLSDLLFVLARDANRKAGVPEDTW